MIIPQKINKDLETALYKEWIGYNERGSRGVDALEDNPMELSFAKGFYRGALWNSSMVCEYLKSLPNISEDIIDNIRKIIEGS